MLSRSLIRRLIIPNSSRYYLKKYNAAFARQTDPGMVVLDAGSGTQPYRQLFGHCIYESADFEIVEKPYAESTYVCNLAEIPVESDRFDRIIFNQVMEHLPDPISVLKELNRVMKKGGLMICTCPLFYEEHEKPYDFYRYTQFSHQFMFKKAGFNIESIEWMEGFFGTVAYQFQGMARYLPTNPIPYLRRPCWPILAWPIVVLVRLLSALLAALFYRLDMACKVTERGYPKNYVVIVRKIGDPPSVASN